MKKKLLAGLLLAACVARADLADSLSNLQGYTVIGVMTVTGWIDRDKGKKGDSFEGCEFDRIIIFDNGKALTCSTYSYSYSYRPRAVILSNGSSFRMIVGDEVYDMRR